MSSKFSAAGARAGLALLCAAIFVSAARAAPPAAPEVIYDAAPKQLLFSWNYVPKANYYELWFKANAGAAWAKFGEEPSYRPRWTANVSAHLLDWFGMRWDIKACNPSGCTGAGADGIDVGSTVVNTVGFVKPSKPQTSAAFGSAIAVSEDGTTIASVAPFERSIPDADGNDADSATVYVFRNTSGKWKQEARFLPSVHEIGNGAGVRIALSRDGNLLALSVPAESSGASTAERGAVYLFRRGSTGWSEERRLTSADSSFADAGHFGEFLKLSEDGSQLAVSSRNDSNRFLLVFRRGEAGWSEYDWMHSNLLDQMLFNMSGDGKLLYMYGRDGTLAVINAYTLKSHVIEADIPMTLPPGTELSTFEVDYAGATLATGTRPMFVAQSQYDPAKWKPAVTVRRRVTDSAGGFSYEVASVLTPSPHQPTSYAKRSLFGDALAMSRTGGYIAVYDPHDAFNAPYVQQPPTSNYNSDAVGSIYLFEKRGTGFRERRRIGHNSPRSPNVDGQGIFNEMAFGADGKTFIASEPDQPGSLGGVWRAGDGTQIADTGSPGAGALWLY